VAQIIRPNYGDVVYVSVVFTETTGRDISSDSFLIGLSSFDEPPTDGRTPDLVTSISASQKQVSLLVGGAYTPDAGTYWPWVQVTDAPETEWVRAANERVIIDMSGPVITLSIVDNGDGTETITGPSVVDNGDGTETITGATVTDNADGTLYIH